MKALFNIAATVLFFITWGLMIVIVPSIILCLLKFVGAFDLSSMSYWLPAQILGTACLTAASTVTLAYLGD